MFASRFHIAHQASIGPPRFFQSHAREARHVVHGSPGGKWGEVECSWLRVELKGMEEAEKSDEDGGELRSFSG